MPSNSIDLIPLIPKLIVLYTSNDNYMQEDECLELQ